MKHTNGAPGPGLQMVDLLSGKLGPISIEAVHRTTDPAADAASWLQQANQVQQHQTSCIRALQEQQVFKCKKCSQPPLSGNYGFCASCRIRCKKCCHRPIFAGNNGFCRSCRIQCKTCSQPPLPGKFGFCASCRIKCKQLDCFRPVFEGSNGFCSVHFLKCKSCSQPPIAGNYGFCVGCRAIKPRSIRQRSAFMLTTEARDDSGRTRTTRRTPGGWV